MKIKKKILAWADSPIAGTGFGVVSKHVLGALHATNKYEIHQLAINFHGEFIDKDECPWELQPARLLDHSDPHGMKMFFRTLLKINYDIVWICNDLFVTAQVAEIIPKIKERAHALGIKPPVFIYYYPVDCKVRPEAAAFLDVVDIPVCYTDHGKAETLKCKPEIEKKLQQIPHGVDTLAYFPHESHHVERWRKEYLGASPDTTVVINVNRNTARKQIPYSMLAFKEFRKTVPNSVMYIHAARTDQGGDLTKVLEDLDLDMKKDVIFPARYSPAHPAPTTILNQLYNCGDMFLTTHLGEGWGLSITESMAAGTPVIAPNNTSMPEQLGHNSERGYLYQCKDYTRIDESGFRSKGLLPDIVEQMVSAYKNKNKPDPKIDLARKWAKKHDWKTIGKKWVELFQHAETLSEQPSMPAEVI
jgi:glycosyltransferase involved in cell wall biosynthesis